MQLVEGEDKHGHKLELDVAIKCGWHNLEDLHETKMANASFHALFIYILAVAELPAFNELWPPTI